MFTSCGTTGVVRPSCTFLALRETCNPLSGKGVAPWRSTTRSYSWLHPPTSAWCTSYPTWVAASKTSCNCLQLETNKGTLSKWSLTACIQSKRFVHAAGVPPSKIVVSANKSAGLQLSTWTRIRSAGSPQVRVASCPPPDSHLEHLAPLSWLSCLSGLCRPWRSKEHCKVRGKPQIQRLRSPNRMRWVITVRSKCLVYFARLQPTVCGMHDMHVITRQANPLGKQQQSFLGRQGRMQNSGVYRRAKNWSPATASPQWRAWRRSNHCRCQSQPSRFSKLRQTRWHLFFGATISMKYHRSTLVTNNSLRLEHTITRKY